jgi:hypothetical protein
MDITTSVHSPFSGTVMSEVSCSTSSELMTATARNSYMAGGWSVAFTNRSMPAEQAGDRACPSPRHYSLFDRGAHGMRLASCARDFTSSFQKAFRRWYSTVFGLMNS